MSHNMRSGKVAALLSLHNDTDYSAKIHTVKLIKAGKLVILHLEYVRDQ